MSTRTAIFGVGARVIVCGGGFRPAIEKHGVVAAVQWVETTHAAGYVYTVQLDEPLIEPRSGRAMNGFMFNESDLEVER